MEMGSGIKHVGVEKMSNRPARPRKKAVLRGGSTAEPKIRGESCLAV
jgi:hypothetical protein